MKYLLDANTYIQAKNQYYGMEFCPAYWEWLDVQFASGEVGSIEFIGKELKEGNDELATWARQRSSHFLTHVDAPTQQVFSEIVNFVMSQGFDPANRDEFLAKGDPWLIAKAKTLAATVVTHEATLSPATKKVKIPNICQQFEVPCIS
ncbi:MAG TPA: DUF4411 family protein, partial [Cellvibrionaceae bacterium]